MRTCTRNRHWLATATVLAVLVTGACSDDDPVAPGNPLIDTWVSTSLVADGTDLSLLGVTLTVTFSSGGTYTFDITGDTADVFCDGTTTCTETGEFTSTATTLTLDSGTVDEVTLNYSISGDELTLTGDIEGTQAVLTFDRQ